MPKELKTLNKEKPLYLGHRARLKARFSVDEGESMPDYELLELLLTISIPRRDVKPLAKKLIAKFNDLNGVINASKEELLSIDGISKNTVVLFKIALEYSMLAGSRNFESRTENYSVWLECVNFCQKKSDDIELNTMKVFYFNSNMELLGEKVFNCHFPDANDFNMHEFITDVIALNATEIVMSRKGSENETGPSDDDMNFVVKTIKILNAMYVELSDYFIFTKGDYFSFKRLGIIPKQTNV